MVSKSDIAATKLRYEQQVYNLQTELNSQQVWHLALYFVVVVFVVSGRLKFKMLFLFLLSFVMCQPKLKWKQISRPFSYFFLSGVCVSLVFGAAACRNNANDLNVIEIHSNSYLRRQRKRSKTWNRIAVALVKRLWIAVTKMINRKSWHSSKRWADLPELELIIEVEKHAQDLLWFNLFIYLFLHCISIGPFIHLDWKFGGWIMRITAGDEQNQNRIGVRENGIRN